MKCSLCCTEISGNGQQVTCGHTFHEVCILDYVSHPGYQFCPTCRRHLFDPVVSDIEDPMFQLKTAAQAQFNLRGRIDFISNPMFPMSLEKAIWIFELDKDDEWMRQDWTMYYEQLPQASQTYDAYQMIEVGRNRGMITCVGGKAPRRLYICRGCRAHVYSSFRKLQNHCLSECHRFY